MTRPPSRKSTAIQPDAPPVPPREDTPAPAPAPPPARLGLAWRIALIVWVLAFGGLLAMELFNLVWGRLR